MNGITKHFLENLNTLLEQAAEQKNQEPKTAATRHWAVVYTELEKVYAYSKTFIDPNEEAVG